MKENMEKEDSATDSGHSNHAGENASWFERNVSLIIVALVIACVGLLVAERVFSPFFDEHHPAHFEIENIFGYQAAIGFAAFVCVVFLGKLLRLIIRRPEGYYDQ